ncbi:Mob1/phocein [Ascobolus immersus RN42]|uniref:Mob1/phocein n=1 Tax=Ascobolus immersus RN42 TaxID=1160509 RepID=A0A3N4IS01_ASCIM|nr:Mob1/phocein [Ascobolus immersus RN42]
MAAASTQNPPKSPRLPSPPPFAENQIEPSHPTVASEPPTSPARNPKSNGSLPSTKSSTSPTSNKYATVRRIRPGTKSAEISTGPPLVPLSELDSAFQLQEHLASLLASRTNRLPSSSSTAPNGTAPEDTPDHTVPLSRLDCESISNPPDGVDPKLWCYELTRRLTRDLNILVVALIQDGCTVQSCPEMRAGEWQYLCAAHDQPQPCCAIEYITHTLDHAAMVLCSTKYFPSRLSMTTSGNKQLSSIFRRLYRIFAHAWFQHRNVFWTVELEYGLYLFFKTASERFSLIPEDTLTIPREAEDLDGMLAEQRLVHDTITSERRNPNGRELHDFGSNSTDDDDSDSDSDSDDVDPETAAETRAQEAEEADLGNGVPEGEEEDEGNPFDDDSSSIDDSSEDEDSPATVAATAREDVKAEQKEAETEDTKAVDEGPPAPDVKKDVEEQDEEALEPELVKPKGSFLDDDDIEGNAEVEELLDSFLKDDQKEQVKPVEAEKQDGKKEETPSAVELDETEPTVEVKVEEETKPEAEVNEKTEIEETISEKQDDSEAEKQEKDETDDSKESDKKKEDTVKDDEEEKAPEGKQ